MIVKTEFSIENASATQVMISGELTRHSISGKQQKVFKNIVVSSSQDIDLSGVNKIDTAGLARLIALFEYATTKQFSISYSQAPQELVKLAQLSGVTDFLPFT